MTNPTPLDRAENGHIWHERVFASMQIKCCMNCGFIKNEKQPNKPCPGPIGVETRAVAPDLDRAIREAVEAERERYRNLVDVFADAADKLDTWLLEEYGLRLPDHHVVGAAVGPDQTFPLCLLGDLRKAAAIRKDQS